MYLRPSWPHLRGFMKREHLLKGAEREAVASADLMHKGFEVFRAMGNFSCDLLAQRDGHILRVEVKGLKNRGGKPPTGMATGTSTNSHHAHCERFDILATVVDSEVFYIPSRDYKDLRFSSDLRFIPASVFGRKDYLQRKGTVTEKNA